MASEIRSGGPLPPPPEQLHLPGPSYQPVAVAIGTSIAVAGVVISPYIVGLGLIILFIALIRWVRDARAEMAELPLEHH